jgi:hypothetical protein
MLPLGDGGFLVVGSTASISNGTVGWVVRLDSEGTPLWNHTYLNEGGEIRYAVALSDGYFLVGNRFCGVDIDGWAAKTDYSGDIIWQTSLGGDGVNKLFGGCVVSGGFVVYGSTYSVGSGDVSRAWMVKLDADGATIWERTFGEADAALRSGVYAQDGTYVAAGYIDSGEGNYDFYLLDVTPAGNLLWNRTYGGAESEKAYSLTNVIDGYVLVGEVESPTSSTDAWVLKVNSAGQVQWSKIVGGAQADSPAFVTASRDGGFLVCGFTFSFGGGQRDFWLLRLNGEGVVQFSCTVGDVAFQEAYAVEETSDERYVLAGWTDPPNRPEFVGKKTYDFYVVEVEAAAGSGWSVPYLMVSAAIFAVLAACLVLMLKVRGKAKK